MYVFNKIGIVSKEVESNKISDTLNQLINLLRELKVEVIIDKVSSNHLKDQKIPVSNVKDMAEKVSLIIVVGGDGTILKIARQIVNTNIPILGINRGKMGFLADLLPEQFHQELLEILKGNYVKEERALLYSSIIDKDFNQHNCTALNDVVLYSGSIARMLEFEVYIDNKFIMQQRSDGLIVATPTGSTAYSLSAGGPILFPQINAMILAPMLPHTLSNRPIVISGNSNIELKLVTVSQPETKVCYDGQELFTLDTKSSISIKMYHKNVTLIHPTSYDYYEVLRKKLGWNANSKPYSVC